MYKFDTYNKKSWEKYSGFRLAIENKLSTAETSKYLIYIYSPHDIVSQWLQNNMK